MNLICKNCNKSFEYHRRKQHCSLDCFSAWRSRPEILAATLHKRAESNMTRYGVANAACAEEFKDKAKKTCRARYGANSPTQNSTVRQKQINTCILRHGVDNPQKNLDIQKRQQSTMFKNYGVTVPTKSKRIMEKIKATVLMVYGTDNPAKNASVGAKMVETNISKYGTKYPMQIREIQKRSAKSLSYSTFLRLAKKLELKKILPAFLASEYTNQIDYREYPFKCQVCNTEFSDHLMHGHIPECPTCTPKKSRSISEDEIVEFIKSTDSTLEVESHNRKILFGLELDIYIPSKKLAIEFNGNYWHSEVTGKKNKIYHIHKTESCEKLGIQLIHIFEDEWIYKNDMIKNELCHLLSANCNGIAEGHDCDIREIDADTSNEFLDIYHPRGADKSSIRLGAYESDTLIAVITLGKKRLVREMAPTSGEYEIYRFCFTRGGSSILSKLVSYFIKLYSPTKIITYIDRRFHMRETCGYSDCGFSWVANTSPTYWYIHPKNSLIREYRFKYRKSSLESTVETFDPTKTEWENMKNNRYDRIWDCGQLKYEMAINNPTK